MADPTEVVHALYKGFFERGVRYFFPGAVLEPIEGLRQADPVVTFDSVSAGSVELGWMDQRYRVTQCGRPFTEHQVRMLGAIGGVLSARYRSIFYPVSALATTQLFEGMAEDRFVSAFLDPAPYLDETAAPEKRDIIADAIEVMRQSSLITYENRRVTTGVLLMGSGETSAHAPDALPYNDDLVSIKSFHRLCDGLNTVFLVDREGTLRELVDLREWADRHDGAAVEAPSARRYSPHSRATLDDRHICLALTPNGEIKIFADGVQVFSFLEGRWRLTDAAEKYREWRKGVGNAALAERLFTASLNLAENRRGGLFVVLDERESGTALVAPDDLLDTPDPPRGKPRIHYLLRGKRVLELEASLIESIARMDGGIVLDRDSNLLAFGAILRSGVEPGEAREGGRTTAAVNASRYGNVLKISEDGVVSHYRGGTEVWRI